MSSAAPKFEVPLMETQVRKSLLEKVQRECSVGTRLPPIQQLAKELGTGFNNTHRAVRQLVIEGVLVSRPRLGTFVADPQRAVSEPRSKRVSSKLAGKVVQTCFNKPDPEGFILRMAAAMEKDLAQQGCKVSPRPFQGANPDLRGTTGVDGIVIFNPNTNPPIQCDPRMVVVVVSTADLVPLNRPGRFDVVTVEQEQSAYLAGRRLRDAGCRSICMVGSRDALDPAKLHTVSALRLQGFERGLGASLPRDSVLTVISHSLHGGACAAESFLKLNPRPEAVFAASDELAVGFIMGTTSHGLQPGRDYDIIGFDGQQIGRDLPGGDLTTVEVPVEQMGRHAAAFLADRLLDPDRPVRKLSLGCSLREGSTIRRKS